MLKRLLAKEGPYEHDINKLFSTEPLASNPKNRCVQLLDVIELPGDPPILVHPLLRPIYAREQCRSPVCSCIAHIHLPEMDYH